MTASDFRAVALSLPESVESSHMDHPDFRVGGKIFATLGYFDAGWGMVKLMPDQQQKFVKAEPKVFVPAKGYWGRRGATCVRLKGVKKATLRKSMIAAWLNAAPRRVAEKFEST
ncbi:MAG TPA: MmcQ/YjbR family DNA-binding protein [Candidatus Acidoferrales bacterium]